MLQTYLNNQAKKQAISPVSASCPRKFQAQCLVTSHQSCHLRLLCPSRKRTVGNIIGGVSPAPSSLVREQYIVMTVPYKIVIPNNGVSSSSPIGTTSIAQFEDISCVSKASRDRCRLVTAEFVLEGTDEPWPELQRTLKVGIAIGRLRFNLQAVDPKPSFKLLIPFGNNRKIAMGRWISSYRIRVCNNTITEECIHNRQNVSRRQSCGGREGKGSGIRYPLVPLVPETPPPDFE